MTTKTAVPKSKSAVRASVQLREELKVRGAFIVFEGICNSGKSAQVPAIASAMRAKGIDCMSMGFPDRCTESGRAYMELMEQLEEEETLEEAQHSHELMAKNHAERQQLIAQMLKEGTTIICDGYSYRSIAYSIAKGVDPEWAKSTEEGFIAPDLVLQMWQPADMHESSSFFDTEVYCDADFQLKVSTAYDEHLAPPGVAKFLFSLSNMAPFKGRGGEMWVRVDADRDPEEITKCIMSRICKILLNAQIDKIAPQKLCFAPVVQHEQ